MNKLEDLPYLELKEYKEKLEQQANELRSRLAKANRVLMIKSINNVKSK